MNREPFNMDEDGTFYDVPPTPPHTLTDDPAPYALGERCELCWGLVGDEQDWDHNEEACTCEYDDNGNQVRGDFAPSLMMIDFLYLRKTHTAKAVAAREAEIAAELEEENEAAIKAHGESTTRPLQMYYHGKSNAYQEAIEIVNHK